MAAERNTEVSADNLCVWMEITDLTSTELPQAAESYLQICVQEGCRCHLIPIHIHSTELLVRMFGPL
jgi:hypothetical protein